MSDETKLGRIEQAWRKVADLGLNEASPEQLTNAREMFFLGAAEVLCILWDAASETGAAEAIEACIEEVRREVTAEADRRMQ